MKERKPTQPHYLVQAFKAWRYGLRQWRSLGAFYWEDEAASMFEHLRIRRHRNGARMYPDLRIIRGGSVLRIERDGRAIKAPPSLEDRVAMLEMQQTVDAVGEAVDQPVASNARS